VTRSDGVTRPALPTMATRLMSRYVRPRQ
jgi:hypothetical protein